MSSPFKHSTYRKLFAAQVTSLLGTGITTIALALFAWELSGERAGEVLGIALALKMVAYVVLSPVMPLLSDHFSRKFWLVAMDVIRMALILSLPWVTSVWQIYLIVFVLSACSAGFTPVFQSLIPDVIDDEETYHKALSYSRMAYELEQLLSPGLAALLLGVMSFQNLFVFDAVTFLVSGLLIMVCTLPQKKASVQEDSYLKKVSFGMRAYLHTPRLRGLLFAYLAVAAASAMVIVNTVTYVSRELEGSERETALMMGVAGLGSLLMTWLVPWSLKRVGYRNLLITGALFLSGGLLSMLAMPGWAGFVGVWFALGVGLAMVQTPAGAIVVRSCHSSDSPSVFAANFSLTHACWFVSYLVAGLIVAHWGIFPAFLCLGLLSLVGASLCVWQYPNPDPVEIEHVHEEFSHAHHHEHDLHHDHADGQADNHHHVHHRVVHKHAFVIDSHHPSWPV